MYYVVLGWEIFADGACHIWQYSAGVALEGLFQHLNIVIEEQWLDMTKYQSHYIVRFPRERLLNVKAALGIGRLPEEGIDRASKT